MSIDQNEKAIRFRALHNGPGTFVIPNPWDTISARLLAGLGFQALATLSAASAAALGCRDGQLTREEALAHAHSIVHATDLPVSADLENGFGDAPEVVAETVRLAADAGLRAAPSRIRPASTIAPSTIFPWPLNGSLPPRRRHSSQAVHADGASSQLPLPAPSLDNTIRRLQAFKKLEPMCSSLPACQTLPRCAPSVRHCRSPSISW